MNALSPTNAHAHDASPTTRRVHFDRYGTPEVLRWKTVARPECAPDEVLVAVRAVSVNPYDWHMMTGTPYFTRLFNGLRGPKKQGLGADVAGVVIARGARARRFQPGDEVFGIAEGSFADCVAVPENALASKPTRVSFEDAAATPVGAMAAMMALRDHGRLEPGQHVLIHGASGGVGTYAVQLARHLGAEVTGVCSARNLELVRSLGAHHVVDYTRQDFTALGHTYDLILDNVGNRKMSHYKRCMTSHGCYVAIGGPKGRFFGPIPHMLKALLSFAFGTRRAAMFFAEPNPSDLEMFGQMLATGELRSVVEAVHPAGELAQALDQLKTGHTRGKIVVRMTPHA